MGTYTASGIWDSYRVSSTSPSSLRILQVTAPARTGGLESVVTQLAVALRSRGHDVHVAAVLSPGSEVDHPFVSRLRSLDVPVHTLLVGARDYLRERRAIGALADSLKISALHTHGYRADVLHGAVARKAGARHVMTLHGFVGGGWRDRVYEAMQIRAARRADVVVAVSRPIVDRLREAGVERQVRLLRNALGPNPQPLTRADARRALGLSGTDTLIGWVGRLSHEKGPDLFVEALAKSPPHIGGVLVGDGPLRDAVRSLAAARGVDARLVFAGGLSDARRYLSAFDAVTLTSRTEGTPMVLLEAMWAGVPIVTTMVGGIPDVVSDREAWCCAPGDSDGLARAYVECTSLGSAELARACQERTLRAQSIVQRVFGIDSWVEAHEDFYSARGG